MPSDDQARPTAEELRKFAAGLLDPAEADLIEDFLETNPEVAEELANSVCTPEFSAAMAEALSHPPAPPDPQLAAAIERFHRGNFSPIDPEASAREVLDEPIGDDGHPGRLGKYEIRRLIAAGGMGLVFEAWDPLLERDVAIKTLSPHLAQDDNSRDRFLREARAAAALDHPNILPILSVEEGETVPFIVMPLMEGTLRDHVKKHGPLSSRHAARLILQTSRALGAAHALGIVHRDIKPANLLLTKDGEVLVTDFGISQREGDHPDASSSSSGTPAFAAPEQIHQKLSSPRSDLYALGATLHYAVNGTAPTETKNGKKLPGWLDRLQSQLLREHPADRPESAAALTRSLKLGLNPLWRAAVTALPFLVLGLCLIVAASFTPLGFTGWVNRLTGHLNGEHIFLTGSIGTYKNIPAAAAALKEGQAVLLDQDGPLDVEPFKFQRPLPLVIRAAPGRRPVLVHKSPDQPLVHALAPIVFEDLILLQSQGQAKPEAMVYITNADLVIRRCAILYQHNRGAEKGVTPLFQVFGFANAVTIEDSIIHSPKDPWLFRTALQGAAQITMAPGPIDIRGSLIIAKGATMSTKAPWRLRCSINSSAVFGPRLFSIRSSNKADTQISQSLLSLTEAVFHNFTPDPRKQLQDTRLIWEGTENSYPDTPLSMGFLATMNHRSNDQRTPEAWREIPSVQEENPATVTLPAPPTEHASLPEIRTQLHQWALDHKAELEQAAPYLPELLRARLGQ